MPWPTKTGFDIIFCNHGHR